MELSLLSPPIAFLIILAVVLLGSFAAFGFARRSMGRGSGQGHPTARGGRGEPVGEGASRELQVSAGRGLRRDGSYLREPYTGGERLARNQFPFEYAQFFPFAFSFIILHVAVLTVATMPVLDAGTAIAGGLYIAGAAIGFVVLMRR